MGTVLGVVDVVVVVDVAVVHGCVSAKRYYHTLHSVTDKRNLVVQIFTAENALSASRYRPAMKKAVTTCCMFVGVLSLRLCD